jgi:hypothetical protein
MLSSDCNAFKLGTESNGGFTDIVVSNCTFYVSERVWKIAANATSSVWSSAFTRFFAPGRLKAELQT